jgi:imidazolonepropionase-like amidohydrolase
MRLLLSAQRVFDGESFIRDAAVLVKEDGIEAVGPLQQIGQPSEVEFYDFGDATLLPGLIDCHDHLAHPGTDLAKNAYVPTSRAVLQTAANLRLTLERGFTAVRDSAGVDLGIKQSVASGLIPGPRLQISLVIITQTSGLGDYYIAATGLNSNVPRLPGIPDGVVDGVDAVRAKARQIIRAGADFLKIATTGGMGTPRGTYGQRQFTFEEVQAVVEEGLAYGLPTAAHAYCGPGLKNALRAGVRSIEHLGPVDDEDLVFMAEHEVYLVPTLCVARYALEGAAPEASDHESLRLRNARRFVDIQKERLLRARELGVKICLGTDIGAFVHGENARELVHLVDAGLNVTEALRAGTSTAAACLGMEDCIGRLRPSFKADIIAVQGDVVNDVSLLRQPERLCAVLLDGKFVVRKVDAANG